MTQIFKGLSQVTDLNIYLYHGDVHAIRYEDECKKKINDGVNLPKKALCFHFDICGAIAMYGGVKTRGCH